MNDAMRADRALRGAAAAWFTVAVAGQWIFALYVALYYGRAAARGDLAAWNRVMPHGFVPGDAVGNFAAGAHLAFALAILLGGAMQLAPYLRRRWPGLHRWTGRVYMMTAIGISLDGLYMVWTRGTVGGWEQHLSISVNALLILLCAGMAWRYAVRRELGAHRRWALRLFLVASGVWFFRVGLMLWLTIHRAPVGFDPDTFRGPFLTVLAFGQYLIPLAVLELYLRSRDVKSKWAMAGGLAILTAGMGVGIMAAAMGMWLPRFR